MHTPTPPAGSDRRPRIRRRVTRIEHVGSSDAWPLSRRAAAPMPRRPRSPLPPAMPRPPSPAATSTTPAQRAYLLAAAALVAYGRAGVSAALADYDAHHAYGRVAA